MNQNGKNINKRRFSELMGSLASFSCVLALTLVCRTFYFFLCRRWILEKSSISMTILIPYSYFIEICTFYYQHILPFQKVMEIMEMMDKMVNDVDDFFLYDPDTGHVQEIAEKPMDSHHKRYLPSNVNFFYVKKTSQIDSRIFTLMQNIFSAFENVNLYIVDTSRVDDIVYNNFDHIKVIHQDSIIDISTVLAIYPLLKYSNTWTYAVVLHDQDFLYIHSVNDFEQMLQNMFFSNCHLCFHNEIPIIFHHLYVNTLVSDVFFKQDERIVMMNVPSSLREEEYRSCQLYDLFFSSNFPHQ